MEPRNLAIVVLLALAAWLYFRRTAAAVAMPAPNQRRTGDGSNVIPIRGDGRGKGGHCA